MKFYSIYRQTIECKGLGAMWDEAIDSKHVLHIILLFLKAADLWSHPP